MQIAPITTILNAGSGKDTEAINVGIAIPAVNKRLFQSIGVLAFSSDCTNCFGRGGIYHTTEKGPGDMI